MCVLLIMYEICDLHYSFTEMCLSLPIMIKMILLILLPVLAILFIINSKGYDHASLPVSGSPGATVFNSRSFSPVSISSNRDIPVSLKNKIRIKAWDDHMATVVAGIWIQPRPYVYYQQAVSEQYNSRIFSFAVSCDYLRGPPYVAGSLLSFI